MVVPLPAITAFLAVAPVRVNTQRVAPRATRICSIRARVNTSASNQTKFNLDAFVSLVKQSQGSLCAEIEAIDGVGKFSHDPWESKSGEGITKGTSIHYIISDY